MVLVLALPPVMASLSVLVCISALSLAPLAVV